MAELRLTLDGPLARVVHDLRGPLQVIRGECFALSRRAASGRQRAGLAAIDAEARPALRRARGPPPAAPSRPRPGCSTSRRSPPPRPAEGPPPAGPRACGCACARPAGAPSRSRGTRRRSPGPSTTCWPTPIRHSPRGGWVAVEVGREAGAATVLVRDRGPGVPAADRERIFAPGERGRDPMGPGAGLGLAIAREVAEAARRPARAARAPPWRGASSSGCPSPPGDAARCSSRPGWPRAAGVRRLARGPGRAARRRAVGAPRRSTPRSSSCRARRGRDGPRPRSSGGGRPGRRPPARARPPPRPPVLVLPARARPGGVGPRPRGDLGRARPGASRPGRRRLLRARRGGRRGRPPGGASARWAARAWRPCRWCSGGGLARPELRRLRGARPRAVGGPGLRRRPRSSPSRGRRRAA